MAKVVQQDDVDMVLHTHRSWCDFGNYESIGKQQAADGKCLATHHPLLKAMLNIQPSGQFLLVQVRSALLKYLVVLSPRQVMGTLDGQECDFDVQIGSKFLCVYLCSQRIL